MPIRVAESIPTGAPTSSTWAATRCATSWSPTRATGARSSTPTACGGTRSAPCPPWPPPARTARRAPTGPAAAVASVLYLDHPREDGQWVPSRHGGREDLDAIAFLQEANATAYKRAPGIVMIAEESTSFPGVTRSTESGGLGFGFKWNMGWM